MWNGGVRVIVQNHRNEILMVKQHHEDRDIWMLPGGAVETGESSKEAAKREVLEETGLIVSVMELIWYVEEISEKRGQRFVNFFLAKWQDGSLALGADPEFDKQHQVLKDVKFFSLEEIKSLENIYPDFIREELGSVLKEKNHRDTYKIRKN